MVRFWHQYENFYTFPNNCFILIILLKCYARVYNVQLNHRLVHVRYTDDNRIVLKLVLLFQIKARKKVAVTVLIFVLVFAVCFLPYHTFMLFFYFNPNAQEEYNDFWHYLRIVGFCLRYLNSCANPVALYWVSGAFRKHFNR